MVLIDVLEFSRNKSNIPPKNVFHRELDCNELDGVVVRALRVLFVDSDFRFYRFQITFDGRSV